MVPKELQVGFNLLTGKADSVQCITILETLIILLSKEDIFVMTLVLPVVLSYHVAFCYCKRLVILLFQLSLEFERLTELDTHSRFDEKLSTYASHILNV